MVSEEEKEEFKREILNILYSGDNHLIYTNSRIKNIEFLIDNRRNKKYNEEYNNELNEIKNDIPPLYDYIINLKNAKQNGIVFEYVWNASIAKKLNMNIVLYYSTNIRDYIKNHKLKPSCVYKTNDLYLIQCGGNNNDKTDAFLLKDTDKGVITLSFELKGYSGFRFREPNLPMYNDDGYFPNESMYNFYEKNPFAKPFKSFFENVCVFEHIGHNINDFNQKDLEDYAISSYSMEDKYADFIVKTDNYDEILYILPRDIPLFVKLEGEFRTSGKIYAQFIYTKNKFFESVEKTDFKIIKDDWGFKDMCCMSSKYFEKVGRRYKLNNIFFIYKNNVHIEDDKIYFYFRDIFQLRTCFTVKGSLKNKAYEIRNYYMYNDVDIHNYKINKVNEEEGLW